MNSIIITHIMMPTSVKILSKGQYYYCPLQETKGAWMFRFQDQWLDIRDYMDDTTRILYNVTE